MTRRIPAVTRRRSSTALAVLLGGLATSSLAQTPPSDRLERITDPTRLPPAEVPYVHPLYRTLDVAPKLIERPVPVDLEAMTTFTVAVRLDEAGKVTESQVVEPPVNGLAAPLPLLVPKWRFSPAKKDGRPVATWATYGIELKIELEKAAYTSFGIHPVAKDEPLGTVIKEAEGDRWMERYPKEVQPKDSSVVSIEDVDVLPTPEKAKWDFDGTRVGSRLTALLEISSTGTVKRLVPMGTSERLVVAWVRASLPLWKLSPGQVKGKPVDCWVVMDATIEYAIGSAKEKSKRVIKKNLRAVPG